MGLGWSEWKKPKIGFIPSSEKILMKVTEN